MPVVGNLEQCALLIFDHLQAIFKHMDCHVGPVCAVSYASDGEQLAMSIVNTNY